MIVAIFANSSITSLIRTLSRILYYRIKNIHDQVKLLLLVARHKIAVTGMRRTPKNLQGDSSPPAPPMLLLLPSPLEPSRLLRLGTPPEPAAKLRDGGDGSRSCRSGSTGSCCPEPRNGRARPSSTSSRRATRGQTPRMRPQD